MDIPIQKIIAKARQDRSTLAVALFGSYARNEPYKDLDLGIFLTPKKYTSLQLSKKKIKYSTLNKKYDINIFQQLPLYIRKRILKEGKILFCSNLDSLYDVYFDTLREFEDYKPVYTRYLEGIAYG